jgi:hypothetical protein
MQKLNLYLLICPQHKISLSQKTKERITINNLYNIKEEGSVLFLIYVKSEPKVEISMTNLNILNLNHLGNDVIYFFNINIYEK